jgi:hypothetical protein
MALMGSGYRAGWADKLEAVPVTSLNTTFPAAVRVDGGEEYRYADEEAAEPMLPLNGHAAHRGSVRDAQIPEERLSRPYSRRL